MMALHPAALAANRRASAGASSARTTASGA
ncbi:Uncharacterised protein [Bordetella pertussis]|nr:Uncharacterised protein [Bordetella pertussis]